MERERCPVCGWDVALLPAFQAQLRAVAANEQRAEELARQRERKRL